MNTYNQTFKTYHSAKQVLQKQLDKKVKVDIIVDLMKNEVAIANSLNDNALNGLKKVKENCLFFSNVERFS